MVQKCLGLLNIFKVVSHISWESDPKILKIIYKALFLFWLNYSSFPLCNGTKKFYYSLEKIQYASLKTILGCMSSAPTSVMQLETHEYRLFIHRQLLLSKFCIK